MGFPRQEYWSRFSFPTSYFFNDSEKKISNSPFRLNSLFHHYSRSSNSASKIFPLPAAHLKQDLKVTSSFLSALSVLLSNSFSVYLISLPFFNFQSSSHPQTKQITLLLLKSSLPQHKVKVKVLVTQSCLTLWDPMDRSLPGSSVHGIFQARILEWVAISFSRGSSRPRDRIHVFCIAERLLSESEGNFIYPRTQGKILEFILLSLVIILELVSEFPTEFLNMQISRASASVLVMR